MNHELASRIAAANEYKRNPDKTWPCVARNRCGVCGEMMEPGQLISRNGPDSPFKSNLRHAECKA